MVENAFVAIKLVRNACTRLCLSAIVVFESVLISFDEEIRLLLCMGGISAW